MTQKSYFWDGTVTGDAADAPYDTDEFNSIFIGLLLTANRALEGVIPSYHSSYSGLLHVTASGTTANVATGAALVDGTLLINSATVGFACGVANNYYTIVARKSWASQTVRLALLGPSAVTYPSVTQTVGVTWEIEIARVFNNAGTLEITDTAYHLALNPVVHRQGGNADSWWHSGTNNYTYRMGGIVFQFGSIEWTGGAASSGSLTVNVPDPYPEDSVNFTYDTFLLPFVNCINDVPYGAVGDINVISGGGAPDHSSFYIEWKSIGGNNYTSLHFSWMTVGQRRLQID